MTQALLCLVLGGAARATTVFVTSVSSSEVQIIVNGSAVRRLAVGQTTPEGVRLLDIRDGAAILEIDRRQVALAIGQATSSEMVIPMARDGTFRVTRANTASFPTWAQDSNAKAAVGDVNGDGRADIVLTGGSSWTTVPMALSRGDGSFWSFGYSGSAGGAPTYGVAAPANVVATLVYGSSYWTITFQNGEKRLFSLTSGWLTAIIDRNGNTTQLSYDALNRLVTVTDPASRHLYFTYATSSSYLVTGISSDVGISLSYAYDAQGRLTQVTNPDLTTLSFAYNSQSLITSVTDSNGKILESHTYDSQGRGLTSSRANGAEAVTISYPNQ